ncbi:MAG: FAD-dependent monooxygenase, partial [Clostridia bacterium]|nr:FAD-dependent monooxygenase [Clostridia bacterium]
MSLAGRGGTVRLTNIKANPGDGEPALRRLCAARLSVSQDAIEAISIVKSSVDARQKPRILMVYTLDVRVSDAVRVRRNAALRMPTSNEPIPARRLACHFEHPPVVVGAGPAGLFAALFLAENGVSPVLVERGKDVDSRSSDVEKFFAGGVFLQESNVQFGEGGAGAFSDGKLSTGTRSPRH